MAARRLSQDDYDLIVTMRERGAKMPAIADAIGCSTSSISWHCLRLGAEPPTPPRPRTEIVGPLVTMRNGFPVRRYTPEDDARLLALEAEGKKETEIARLMGRRFNSIRGRLMTLARRDARMEAVAHG